MKGFTTRSVHADRQLNRPLDGAVHQSISSSVLFHYDDAQGLIDVFQGKQAGHVYSRSSSSSVNSLESILTSLERGKGAIAFSTGMAAISSAVFSLFRSGDHLIVSHYLFGNSKSFFKTASKLGIEISFVDVTNIESVRDALQINTKGVFTETIANPVTQVADIIALGHFCGEQNLLFMVDSTMTPSPMFDAKKHNVGLLFCSLTKYFGGHGNALGGMVIDLGNYDWTGFVNIEDKYRGQDSEVWGLTQIRKLGLRDMGATLSPHAAHTFSTGIETLALRMERNQHSAMQVAQFLNANEKVARVNYPGLVSHPQHQLARQQFNGYGAILSVEFEPSVDVVELLNRLKLVLCATHLGDNRTLAIPVAPTIFFEHSDKEKEDMGISPNLLRLSIGIEDTQDIVDDFQQALST